MKRQYFLNIPFDYLTLKTVSNEIIRLSENKSKKPNFITYVNANNLNLALIDKEYKEILSKADLVYADGWGAVFALRFLNCILPERISTDDFFLDLAAKLEEEKLSLFLLGSKEKVIRKAVLNLKKQFPKLKILGFQNGYNKRNETLTIIRRINKLKPDILLVGMGSAKQEKWLHKHLPNLQIKVGWAVGGLFDFLAKEKPRCPKFIRNNGFEWLFRLFTEFRRLWKRYLIDLPIFLIRILSLKFTTNLE